MINVYTDDGQDSNELIKILHEKKVEFTNIKINTIESKTLRYLTGRMRTTRGIYGKTRGPSDKWQTTTLALPPIIEIEDEMVAYPWWYIREKLDMIIHEIKAKQKTKKLTIIGKLTKTTNTKKSGKINIDLTSDARINVTVLRAINGIDITDVINVLPMGERAAAVIMWRIAQHQRSDELLMLADMIESKAMSYDPYKKSYEWIGNEDSWSD